MKYCCLLFILFSVVSAQTFRSVIQRLEHSPVAQRQQIVEQYLTTKRFSPIIEQDTVAHFIVYRTADSVFITGDLQHWTEPVRLERIPCGTFSFFYKTFSIPSDARLDYQLIVDGAVILDPRNPRITPSGYGPHSEIRMPKFTPSPYLEIRNDVARGTIDSLGPRLMIPTPLRRYLPSERSIKVYTPSGYDTLSHLSVVYVHDGFEAMDFMSFPNIIDNLIADNVIVPIIAVFVPPMHRQDEYGEKRERYVQYLSDDLVPLIDRLYRTDPVPHKRAMIGISGGGHISLFSVFRRPDVFQNAGGQSSTITPWLTELTRKQVEANRIPPRLKIYLDCGRFDIMGQNNVSFFELNRNYSDLLSSFRIPHYYKELNDGHQWASWRERIPGMLVYFFGKYQ